MNYGAMADPEKGKRNRRLPGARRTDDPGRVETCFACEQGHCMDCDALLPRRELHLRRRRPACLHDCYPERRAEADPRIVTRKKNAAERDAATARAKHKDNSKAWEQSRAWNRQGAPWTKSE